MVVGTIVRNERLRRGGEGRGIEVFAALEYELFTSMRCLFI